MTCRLVLFGCFCSLAGMSFSAEAEPSRDEVAAARRQAITFFRDVVAVERGGYLWQYSADLSRREGEGRASATTAWVQPPGTPSVGEALLDAYRMAPEPYILDAARLAGEAIVRGQLCSGGWDYRIEFDPKQRTKYAYRVDGCDRSARNVTTLDDDTTQSALRFLMHLDQVLEFENESIHNAVVYALEHLLDAQYPNGAWPQRFQAPPDPDQFPVLPASYPEQWSRTYPAKDYRSYYTFNDNSIADMIRTMFEAAEIYDDSRYERAARKAGDFILLAQMPDPQPAWAQQYDAAMHPAWARKFEPPAVTGGESQGILRILLYLYQKTGDRKYLEPVPRALAYLKKSRRSDGKLARFYELKTNRPLYFTRDYELTYDDSDMPTHYAFVVGSGLDSIERQYQQLLKTRPEDLDPPRSQPRYRRTERLTNAVRQVIDSMDERGAWVEEGRLRYHGDDDPTRQVITTRTFIRNLQTLSEYLATE